MTVSELESLMRKMEAEINRLRTINSVLLAACEAALRILHWANCNGYVCDMTMDACRQAIARAKDQQP